MNNFFETSSESKPQAWQFISHAHASRLAPLEGTLCLSFSCDFPAGSLALFVQAPADEPSSLRHEAPSLI